MASALQFQFSSDSEAETEDESFEKGIEPSSRETENSKAEKPKSEDSSFKYSSRKRITCKKELQDLRESESSENLSASFGREAFHCSMRSIIMPVEQQQEISSMDSGTRELLKLALQKHPLFQTLVDDTSILQNICGELIKQEISAGQNLWNQGDNATVLYFVQTGKFHVFKNVHQRDVERVQLVAASKSVSSNGNSKKEAAERVLSKTSSSSSLNNYKEKESSGYPILTRNSVDFGKLSKPRTGLTLTIGKSSALNDDYVSTTDVYGTSSVTPKASNRGNAMSAVSPSHFAMKGSHKAPGSFTKRNNSQSQLSGVRGTTSSTDSSSKSRNGSSWLSDAKDQASTQVPSLVRGLSWVKTQLQSKASLKDLLNKNNAVAPDPSTLVGPVIAKDSGSMKIRVKSQNFRGEQVVDYGPGDTVGDYALFYGVPRSTTVTCVSDAVVWSLDAIVFRHYIALADSIERGGFGDELQDTPALQNLSSNSLQQVGQHAKMVHFPKGKKITTQGAACEYVYVIQCGRVLGRQYDRILNSILRCNGNSAPPFIGPKLQEEQKQETADNEGGGQAEAGLANGASERQREEDVKEGSVDGLPKDEQQEDIGKAELGASGAETGTPIREPDSDNPLPVEKESSTVEPDPQITDQSASVGESVNTQYNNEDTGEGHDETKPRKGDSNEGNTVEEIGDEEIEADSKTCNVIEYELSEQQLFGASLLNLSGPADSDTIAATEDVFCLQVPVSAFQKHFTQEKLEHGAKLTALLSVELLNMLEKPNLKKLHENTVPMEFKRGDQIIKAFTPATRMYVVGQGTCLCVTPTTAQFEDGTTRNTNGISLLSVGQSFGEVALLPESDTYDYDVYAAANVSVWPFEREEFVKLVSSSAATKKQLQQLVVQRVLQQVPILKTLRANKLKQVSSVFEQKGFEDGYVIVKEGAPGTDFFVIWNGCVRITKETKEKGIVHLCDLHGGDFFGEMALLSNGIRSTNCTAVGHVECFVISQNSFTRMVGEELLPAMQTIASNRIQYTSATLEAAKNKMIDDMQLTDLEMGKPIGKGGFGYVQLVKYKKDGSSYALKQINKRRLYSAQGKNVTVENIIIEKNALFDIKHPFSVRPFKTFVDESNMYILMELIEAGELYEVIQNRRNKTRNRDSALKAPHASFYAACVISVLSYMHQRRYIYRDLKPENLMIDSGGFVKVIDFGLVKRMLDNHTYTFCGTPEYLAPEIISGKGYAFEVDWWSLGVLVFEMLVGVTPFRDSKAENIMKKVLEKDIEFPECVKDKEAKDLILKLLDRNPVTRLGGTSAAVGGKDVKNHRWFSAVNWKGIIERHVKPPWTPKFKDSNEWDSISEKNSNLDGTPPSAWKEEWDKAWLEIPRG